MKNRASTFVFAQLGWGYGTHLTTVHPTHGQSLPTTGAGLACDDRLLIR